MKQIRLYQIITAISCLFLISCGIEQNLKKADKHLSLGEYFDAATQYKKVYTKTPTKERAARGKVALKMARCYLSDLYKIFDDWSLVIAAYNCGPTNVNKAIHRAKGNADYWNIYPYLPKETRGYVPAFIAANYIMNYYCDHNICPMVSELPVKTDTIVVSKDIHLEQISKVLNINIEHLRNLNPQYRHDIINGLNHPMALRLPSTLIGSFIDQQDSICAYRADELFLKRATVDVNDAQPTYSRPRSSYSRHSASSRSKKSSKRGRNRKQGNKSVTIKNGDTLSEIAARHGTTVKKLRKLNGIKGNSIRAGKKIKVK